MSKEYLERSLKTQDKFKDKNLLKDVFTIVLYTSQDVERKNESSNF